MPTDTEIQLTSRKIALARVGAPFCYRSGKRSLLEIGQVTILAAAMLLPEPLNVRAQSIPLADLFNTGVGGTGVALADGGIDPHYRLVVNADSSSTNAIVENSQAFPIVSGPWVTNAPNSKWIGPRFDTSAAAALAQGNGIYVYRTTFNLTGLDRSSVIITGEWAVDNAGLSIRVNGLTTGLVNTNGFSAFTPFAINPLNATFIDGVNTLDFEVQNNDAATG